MNDVQKYGMLKEGTLIMSDTQFEGYKPVEYAEIPNFDQTTQYIIQTAPVDKGDHIFIGIEIKQLELDEGDFIGEPNVF